MTANTPPVVSVLTPVYNGEKYLAQCIESVLAQTYPHWDYLIVNNRSTDRTLAIAERYAQQDARIRIETNHAFVGAIQNHNIAFRQTSSQAMYCKILHADDQLFPECLSRMIEVAKAHPSVGVVGSYTLQGEVVRGGGIQYPAAFVQGREICRRTLLGELYVFGPPSSLLLRADLIRRKNTFFNEAHIHADTEACFEVLQDSDFGFVHQVLSYVRRHDESVSTTFSHRYNTYIISELEFLRRYGPIYLERAEYEERFSHKVKDYYRFMGKSLLLLRDRGFWDYHRRELARIGCPFSITSLLKGFSLEITRALTYPLRAIWRTACLVRRGGSVRPYHPHAGKMTPRG
jgi:glycosyltransferase involved in cell wall biosynthesis